MRNGNDDDADCFLQYVMFNRECQCVLPVTFPSTSPISRSNYYIPHLHVILGYDHDSVLYFEWRYDLSALVDDLFRSTSNIEEPILKSAFVRYLTNKTIITHRHLCNPYHPN